MRLLRPCRRFLFRTRVADSSSPPIASCPWPLVQALRLIGQLPHEGQDVLRGGFEDVRIDRVGAVCGLMKVRMDAAADDGDGRHGEFAGRGGDFAALAFAPFTCARACATTCLNSSTRSSS